MRFLFPGQRARPWEPGQAPVVTVGAGGGCWNSGGLRAQAPLQGLELHKSSCPGDPNEEGCCLAHPPPPESGPRDSTHAGSRYSHPGGPRVSAAAARSSTGLPGKDARGDQCEDEAMEGPSPLQPLLMFWFWAPPPNASLGGLYPAPRMPPQEACVLRVHVPATGHLGVGWLCHNSTCYPAIGFSGASG